MTLLSRNALKSTHRLRSIAEDVARLPARALVLDGEIIAGVEVAARISTRWR